MDINNLESNQSNWEEKRGCDGCTVLFEENDHVATYFSDWVWNEFSNGEIPFISPQGMYCLNCYENEIPIPKKGVIEGFIFETITFDEETETYSTNRRKILRGSSSSEGIDWDPVQVVDRLFPAPAELILKDATPFSVFTLLYRAGIDLRGFVREGQLEIPDSAAKKARLIIDKLMEQNHSFNL
ncbi:hypothetical protein [Haloferax sp. Atlit-19N]|uniref:hypothetical protein n=1 Tax=Haloferax sp. Atlit-19N TaxID=2077201 RepID=UPI0011C03E43|nr:hypothetical protein [Haloferax sp. Atlit-19N]